MLMFCGSEENCTAFGELIRLQPQPASGLTKKNNNTSISVLLPAFQQKFGRVGGWIIACFRSPTASYCHWGGGGGDTTTRGHSPTDPLPPS